jgi:hypothetical protein
VPQAAGPDELVTALVARQRGRRERPEWQWADTLQVGRDEFLRAARVAEAELAAGRRSFADFLSACGCELSTDGRRRLEPTAFYMTSGQQRFLKEVRELAGQLAEGGKVGRRPKPPEEMFREALFGPWRYEDPQHSLGLDPATERLHALRAVSPTKEPSAGVAAAVGLACEALPLFPCFLSGGRLATTGFTTRGTRRDRVTFLTWAVWAAPLALPTVRSLLALPELAEERPPARELRARGVEGVFRSERYKVKSQGNYFILRPAAPCL